MSLGLYTSGFFDYAVKTYGFCNKTFLMPDLQHKAVELGSV